MPIGAPFFAAPVCICPEWGPLLLRQALNVVPLGRVVAIIDHTADQAFLMRKG